MQFSFICQSHFYHSILRLADMAEFALKKYVCFLRLREILSLKNSA